MLWFQRENFLRKMVELQSDNDGELAHIVADRLLCDLLTDLGYGDLVKEYDKIGKWYA